MSMKTFAVAALAGWMLAAAPLPAQASDRHCERAAQGNWLGIGDLVSRLEAKGYRDISKVEREHRCYEVRASNAEGQRMKLVVDPTNAEILHSRNRW